MTLPTAAALLMDEKRSRVQETSERYAESLSEAIQAEDEYVGTGMQIIRGGNYEPALTDAILKHIAERFPQFAAQTMKQISEHPGQLKQAIDTVWGQCLSQQKLTSGAF